MSHLVIARKWRPGLFEEVVGQQHVVKTLSNAVESGRVGHAYLFSGPRGVGKTTVARILAKCLNCEKGPTSTPCNECASCVGVKNGSSVDVLEIDAASNTGVDNIRELRENVRYAPSLSRHKVYIIDEVHMLSGAAFNALLKTLEEPPPHVIFVFATTEPHKIPLTIHSRCQRFDFRRIPLGEVNAHLKKVAVAEGVAIDDEAVYIITRESEGSLRDAQSLLEQVIAFAGEKVTGGDVSEVLGLMDRTLLLELLGVVLEKNPAKSMNTDEKIHDFGYDFKKVASELLEHVRDLIVVKVLSGEAGSSAGATLPELPDSELKKLKSLAENVSLDTLQLLFAVLSKGYEEVSRSSVPRFSLEMALLRAARLEDLTPVGELIETLEGLKNTSFEARGEGAGGAGAGDGADRGALAKDKGAGKGVTRLSKTQGHGSNKGAGARSTSVAGKDTARALSRESAPSETVAAAPTLGDEDPSAESVKGASTGINGGLDGGIADTEGLLDFVKQKNGRLHGILKSASPSLEGTVLRVVPGPEDIGFIKARTDAIETVCTEYLKRKVKLDIIEGGQAGEPRAMKTRAKETGLPAEASPELPSEVSAKAPSKSVSKGSPENSQGGSQGNSQKAANDDGLVNEARRILGARVIEDRRRGNV